MLLKGKTAVLTGCNKGIGKALLEVFAKNGANIWACVRQYNEKFMDYITDVSEVSKVTINPVYFAITSSRWF